MPGSCSPSVGQPPRFAGSTGVSTLSWVISSSGSRPGSHEQLFVGLCSVRSLAPGTSGATTRGCSARYRHTFGDVVNRLADGDPGEDADQVADGLPDGWPPARAVSPFRARSGAST